MKIQSKKQVRIGMVGVGRMGSNMAFRMQEVGFTISCVYDRNTQVSRRVARQLRVPSVSRLADVTQRSDVILTVVSDDAAMKKIFATTGDSLLKKCQGKLFINCATISPIIHQKLESILHRLQAESLEACMASSITQARNGTLYLMCGGTSKAFKRAQPILKAMSASLCHIGPSGEAAKVKALVNMVMNINTAGLAEGLGLGQALGLDLCKLREVFSQTGANSRVLETDGEDMQNRSHDCFFSAAHAEKDSSIALSLAKTMRLKLPLALATKKQYQRLKRAGKGNLDKSAISELTFPGRLK